MILNCRKKNTINWNGFTTKEVVVSVYFLLFSIFAYARADEGKLAKLETALQSLRSAGQLPALVASQNNSLTLSNEAIPYDAQETFKQIQMFVYGRDSLIALRACDGCQAVADANTMSVYLEPNFLKSLKSKFGDESKNIIAFILAHEISHFSYEYIVVSAANNLSPNGNIALLTKSFSDFIDLAKFISMTPEEQQAEIKKYLMMAGPGHAEVDLLGLLTLKEMNIQVSLNAVEYIQDEVASRTVEELAQTDFELRLQAIIEAISSGKL